MPVSGTIELFKQSSLIIHTFYDYCKAIAMYNDKFNDCIVSGSIYNEFCTLKTLLTQEISFPLQFFQFLLKITQNYTQFEAHNFHCNSKKKQETGKVFQLVSLGFFFFATLADWSIGRTRDWSFDCSRLIAGQLMYGNGVKGAVTYLLPKLCQ